MSNQPIGMRLAVEGEAQATAAIDRTSQALNRMGAAHDRATVPAGQTAEAAEAISRALGTLAPQLGDTISQLSAGGSALTTFVQQGLQLRDQLANDATAMAGFKAMITPTTVGLGLLAAGVAGVTAAYIQGSAERDEFERAVTMSGGAAGLATDQLADYAREMRDSVGTTHAAAGALAVLAETGKVGAQNIRAAGAAAIKMERELGVAVNKTAGEFADLAGAPLAASLRLNDSLHYLTAQTYEHIRSLEQQGKLEEAGAVAQEAYATAMNARMDKLTSNLGTLESALRGVTGWWKEMWDAALNIGREDTLKEKLEKARASLEEAQGPNPFKHASLGQAVRATLGGGETVRQELVAERQQELDILSRQYLVQDNVTASAKAAADYVQDRAKWDADTVQYMTRQEQKQRALEQLRQQAAKAGQLESERYREGVRAIEQQYDTGVNLVQIQSTQALQLERITQAQNALNTERVTGRITERAAIEQITQFDLQAIAVRRAALAGELAVVSARRGAEAQVAQITGQIAQADAQATTRRLQGKLQLVELEERERRVIEDNATRAYTQQQQRITGAEADLRAQQERNEAIGVEGLALVALTDARARANITLLEERLQLEVMQGATPERLAALQREIDLQTKLADARKVGGTKDAAQAALGRLGLGSDAITNKLDLSSVKDAVQGLDSPLGTIVDRFQVMIDLQAKFAQQTKDIAILKAAGGKYAVDALQKEADLAQQMEQARLSGYASMASAAKGFFSEGSKGYKALHAAENTFRAVELASAVKNAAVKMGLIEAETAAKVGGYVMSAAESVKSTAIEIAQAMGLGSVLAALGIANQAKGDPYSAFPRMAAMAAAMAALGFAVSSFSGSGPTVDPGNTGTGTVFGDDTAKSESIANSLDRLTDIDTLTMRYSAQMADSLRNIESNIAGVTNLLVRAGAADAAAAGIQVGTQVSTMGKIEGAMARGAAAYVTFGLTEALGLGDAISGLAGKLFNTKTSITGQGIYADPQRLGDVMAGGFDASYYADVYTRKKKFGITTSRSNSTQLTEADAELERQFGAILTGFADTVKAAAGPLGASLDLVEQRLSGFVFSLGKINIKDLSGEEIQEKLSAVFGAAGDNIAQAAMPGLERFQAVGEGYLETTIRVATSLEQVNAMLKALDQTALQASVYGAQAALDLADAFGGLDKLSSATQAYYDAVTTDAEKLADSQQLIRDTLASLGQPVPATVAQYKQLVAAQDKMTESGRQAWAMLTALGPTFADVAQQTEELAKSARDTMITGAAARNSRDSQVAELRLAAENNAAEVGDRIRSMFEAVRGQSIEAQIQADTAAKSLAQATAGWVLLYRPLKGMELEMEKVRVTAEAMRGELTLLYGNSAKAQEIIGKAVDRQQELLRRDWLADVDDQLLKLRDSSAYAAEALRREQEQRLADAAALGLSSAELARVIALNEAQTKALQEQQGAWKATAGKQLRGWLDSQLLGTTSTLDPGGKLSAAQSQFADLLGRARASDQDALSNITGAADALITAGQAMNGSNAAQAALVQWTRQSLQSLGAALSLPGFSPAEQKAEAKRQTAALEQAVTELQALVVQNTASNSSNVTELRALATRLAAIETLLRREAA